MASDGEDQADFDVGSGKVKVRIGQSYPFTESAQVRRDLEARRTTGSTLLIPSYGKGRTQ